MASVTGLRRGKTRTPVPTFKRLVRAAFRATHELFPAGLDLVVVVRKPLGELKLAAVIEEWRGATSALRRRIADLLAPKPAGAKASP